MLFVNEHGELQTINIPSATGKTIIKALKSEKAIYWVIKYNYLAEVIRYRYERGGIQNVNFRSK